MNNIPMIRPGSHSFNYFTNLDSVETRVINYIKNSDDERAKQIWKLLKYSDMRALFKDDLSQQDKEDLIYKDADQMNKRVFNFSFIEDMFDEACSLIKIYVYSIEPVNHLISNVNIGIDILSHNKLSNVYNPDSDPDDNGRVMEEDIVVKNRNTVLLRNVLSLLNGALINGVGQLQFNQQLSQIDNVQSKLSNNRNFYGYTIVMSCQMSSLGGPKTGG